MGDSDSFLMRIDDSDGVEYGPIGRTNLFVDAESFAARAIRKSKVDLPGQVC